MTAVIVAIGVMGAIVAGPAAALPVDAAWIGSGSGCVDSGCFLQTLTVDSSTPGTGTLTLGASSISFEVTVPLTSYVPLSGSDDNGVTMLDFVDVVYNGSGSTSPGSIPGNIDLSGSASVAGSVSPVGAGTAGPFSFASVDFVGSCSEVGSNYLCGIIFSTQPDANLEVNGETRYFAQTLNLTTIPEPGTALLLGTGLALLAARRRS